MNRVKAFFHMLRKPFIKRKAQVVPQHYPSAISAPTPHASRRVRGGRRHMTFSARLHHARLAIADRDGIDRWNSHSPIERAKCRAEADARARGDLYKLAGL